MNAQAAAPLRVLVVCTGNICRSAFAASYLRAGMARVAPGAFAVSSAGTGWHDQLRVPREVRVLGARHGLDIDRHEGRLLTEQLIRDADLVLTATREHRQAVLAAVPAALKRTYLLTEFAELIAAGPRVGTDPDAWRAAIRTAAMHRGSVTGRDVPDPYGRELAAYDHMKRVLLPALDAIVAAAGPVAKTGPAAGTTPDARITSDAQTTPDTQAASD